MPYYQNTESPIYGHTGMQIDTDRFLNFETVRYRFRYWSKVNSENFDR